MTPLSGDAKLITLTKYEPIKVQNKYNNVLDEALPFYFHIAPAAISYSKPPSYSDQQVVRRGTISQFGGPGLLTISWDGEFAVEKYLNSYGRSTYIIPEPSGFKLRDAHKSKKNLRSITDLGLVIRLTIQDRVTGRVEESLPVTIRDFSMSENGGEPDTRFYSIQFAEYRTVRLRTVPRGGSVSSDTNKPSRPLPGRYVSSPYTVPRDMGIYEVARIAYHNQSLWRDIVDANGGRAGMIKKGCIADGSFNPTNGPYRCPKGVRLSIPNKNIPQAR